jgi:hypothetical protein
MVVMTVVAVIFWPYNLSAANWYETVDFILTRASTYDYISSAIPIIFID